MHTEPPITRLANGKRFSGGPVTADVGAGGMMQALQYKQHDADTGPRIGGTVPDGLEDHIRDEVTQYFGTFPVAGVPALEFSVFHRFEVFGEDEKRDIIDHNNQILKPSELIWAVVHGPSERGDRTGVALEARSLTLSEEAADEVTDDEGSTVPYTESKVGGKCFLERYWLQDQVSELEGKGYRQLLQVGMHDGDLIDGFPWDPGYLHVWALDPRDMETYRFMVEQ